MSNKDLYNINKYDEDDLLQMLNLNNPSDRELEAKILQTIEQYNEVDGEEATRIKNFFEDVYNFFFDKGNIIEGFDGSIDEKGLGDFDSKENTEIAEFQDEQNEEKDKNLQQTTSLEYSASQLNPLLKETQKRVLQLDSQFRNYQVYPSSTDYIINLSEVLNNVVSLRLHSISIPYTWYNVSNVYNANFFRLQGNVDGLDNSDFDLKIEIPAGSYDKEGLITTLNNSIATVASENTDIEFGTTGFTYDVNTSKVTFTIDIQQIYNETNYYIYFGKATNPFDDTVRKQTIPGFLGFGFMVIPHYRSETAEIVTDITRVDSTYSLESIYSNFQSSLNATGITTASGETPILTNSYDPNTLFYLVIDNVNADGINDVSGNNFFTIYNYEGPGNYDVSSTILNTIRIEFGDVSGLYTRSTLQELINRSLLSSEFLSNNSFLHEFDISYNNTNGSITTLQRFQMMVLLNRETTTKQLNSKQIVVFPDETIVYDNLTTDEEKALWSGPLWTGQSSCFMFELQNLSDLGTPLSNFVGGYVEPFNQPNNVKAEQSPVQTLYELTSEPKLTLRCMKLNPNGESLYDVSANNRQITLSTDVSAGYPLGYTLNDYIGIYNYTLQYKSSEINEKFSQIQDLNGEDISGNGYVNANAFYDIGINRSRIQFDILTYFNEVDYELDLSECFLQTIYNIGGQTSGIVNGNGILSIDDISENLITFTAPANVNYPLTLDETNNKITVKAKSDVSGLINITDYIITFPVGQYRTPLILQTTTNTIFSQIQGTTDASGTPLNNLNMIGTRFIDLPRAGGTVNFRYVINNKLSQDDYIVELEDSKSDYENQYINTNGNNRYYLQENVNDIGVPILNTETGTNYNYAVTDTSYITGTSWNAFLGFTDVSYSLQKTREMLASRNVMIDISKTMIVEKDNNDAIFFIPQSSVKGLSDSSGVKRITLTIPQGIYTEYTLYNQINTDLSNNSQVNNSIMYSSFDEGNEYAVLQTCVNQVYTAQDYELIFYDASSTDTMTLTAITANSFSTTTWDVTIGWLLGFRSYPRFNLSGSAPLNSNYVLSNEYTIDSSTNIITLLGDSPIDLYLFKNLYLILDDFTQSHLNDGLITGLRQAEFPTNPPYSSQALEIENLATQNPQSTIFNSIQPGMPLTQKQLVAANTITEENNIRVGTKLYSDPPFVKDMFALIPIKVSGLAQGEVFVEYGGTLQDNDRKYFGPVTITKLRIRLLNDHGDIVNLNGANWSFSFVFEYLYNLKGV